MLKPQYIVVQIDSGEWIQLNQRADELWEKEGIIVSIEKINNDLLITSLKFGIQRIQISWNNHFDDQTLYIGDDFERNYGNLKFETINPEKKYHWYCIAKSLDKCSVFGVKIQPNGLCAWTVCRESIDLWIDIRNGALPIDLSQRNLNVCSIVINDMEETDFWVAHKHFCKLMADKSETNSAEIIFGSNDWNFAYGNNSKELIFDQADFMNDLVKAHPIKPWIIIDDGWQKHHSATYNGGPWDESNDKFGSMREVAERIEAKNCLPGIWFRPLLTALKVPEDQILRDNLDGTVMLDPSHPRVLERVRADIQRISDWGFKIIKHDFTTYDIFGKFGLDMDLDYYSDEVLFYDKSKTTGEIIKNLYNHIANVSPTLKFIGCNTISHFSANTFDIMRIGDDTSGRSFARTRKMGVNSLAFRSAQDNIFYSIDPDCVGITDAIDWEINKKWLDLVAFSSTALFISCDPHKLSCEMKSDLQNAVTILINQKGQSIKPVDFQSNMYPNLWQSNESILKIDWFETPRLFYSDFG